MLVLSACHRPLTHGDAASVLPAPQIVQSLLKEVHQGAFQDALLWAWALALALRKTNHKNHAFSCHRRLCCFGLLAGPQPLTHLHP